MYLDWTHRFFGLTRTWTDKSLIIQSRLAVDLKLFCCLRRSSLLFPVFTLEKIDQALIWLPLFFARIPICCLNGCTRTFQGPDQPVVLPPTPLSSDPNDDDEEGVADRGRRLQMIAVCLRPVKPHVLMHCMMTPDSSFTGSERSDHDSMEEPSILQMQKAAASFLLTLKEQHRPTQVAITCERNRCNVKTEVENVLIENSFVTSINENTNPFIGLETEHRQKQVLRKPL